ncbi:hypothetical protein [Nostoc sp.]|uniref:hypothetical protein n=1 Tax=Nostoc sp. TaxID=1180 RepID=UPI002FFA0666
MYVYLHQAEKKLMRWLLPALAAGGATYNEPQDHSFMSLSPMDSGEAAQSSNRDV